MEGGATKWMDLVMKMKKPGMSLKAAMKAAKKVYKKSGKKTRRGGNLASTAAPVGSEDVAPAPATGGRRKRRGGKTRRTRKH